MDMTMLNDLLTLVKTAGSEFRSAPFWSWNAKLEPEELRRQIRVFHEMGMGGFFMHSRVGLNTPYLSKDWFKCIDACVDEAKKLGMQAWLYDEDRWPSGAAGGLVTSNPAYRGRSLRSERAVNAADLKTIAAERLACFVAKFARDGETIISAKRVAELPAKAPAGKELLVFHVHVMEPNSWFNDQTYVDTLNPDAVKQFLKVTHEAYWKKNGADFGGAIPGVFTDEPNYSHAVGSTPHAVPWTDRLPELFRKRFGYDLLDHLPELGYDFEGMDFSRARHDFYEEVTTLFVESFGKLIGDWCGEHHLKYTGHVLEEDNLYSQRHSVGDAMRFYEFQQQPGIDLLCETWSPVDTAKQCSSVAHQLDKPVRLCECYGVTGWDFPFAGHKALGDWLAVLGINFRCPHLAWYSMEGEAKRDYPASISFQSPWYPYYPLVENYFAHQAAALRPGREVRDILVVHPIESAWGAKAFMNKSGQKPLNAIMIDVRNLLLENHLDFDYGCEDHLARFGSVVGQGRQARLQVGVASYKVVVLPKMTTIRSTTLKLLESFVKAGGQVVYMEAAPKHLDAVESAKPAEAYAAFTMVTAETLAKTVEPLGRRVSIRARGEGELPTLLYMLKQGEDFETLFVCNTSMPPSAGYVNDSPRLRDRTAAYDKTVVTLKSQFANPMVYELDQRTGDWMQLNGKVHANGKTVRITTPFTVLESRLYLITNQKIADAIQENDPMENSVVFNATLLPPFDKYMLDEPNAMVLDQAIYEVDGKGDGQVHYILKIDDAVRTQMGQRPRGGRMVQPWVTSANAKPSGTVPLKLTYSFEVEELPPSDSPFSLAMERPDLYTVTLNDKKIEGKAKEYWVDPAIRILPLEVADLRKGLNLLVLECDYHELQPGLEAIYLLGEFGVKGTRTMTALPDTLQCGNVCDQGLPNYSGNITYYGSLHLNKPKKGERIIMSFLEWKGVALGVKVNNGKLHLLGWPPYRLDITDEVRPGKNNFEFVLLSSRRNVFGPFYGYDKSPVWCNSDRFKLFQITDRQLVDVGLEIRPFIFYVKNR